MQIDNCCGQLPHNPDCVIVTHGMAEQEELPQCEYCDSQANTLYYRWTELVGCENCIEEMESN